MNRQELLEKLTSNRDKCFEEANKYEVLSWDRQIVDSKALVYMQVINWVEQLAEQPKVTVPQFVAKWIKQCKEKATLADCLDGYYEISNGEVVSSEDFQNWVADNENDEMTAKAWIFGYEVEEEQLYQVKIPTVNWDECSSELVTEYAYLIWDITSDEYKLSASNKDYKSWRASLTESEIKSIDERYWAFAVQVEEDK
ncbi:DUF1642 domain-containing protein [Enterococcus gallinarum]|uniref:DUF1642 domain-containing protein n=1 Tax=Enterococcus gallinarum TaxID=1353 RepID=UPI001330A81F|nr:DUF1642 domain-containing protein [Enterococcus gallinarum]